MATSTTLFPELVPETYDEAPLPGQLAVADSDNGAEQVSERRAAPLMRFSWRSQPLELSDQATMETFLQTCGSGFVNFSFYQPFSAKYASLFVGYTDGINAYLDVGYRNLNAWDEIRVNGIQDVGAGVTHEFTSPTKEDRVTLSSTPAYGLPVTLTNVFGRRRFICRMISWRRFLYAGGYTQAIQFDPLSTTVPIMPMVYELTFREKL